MRFSSVLNRLTIAFSLVLLAYSRIYSVNVTQLKVIGENGAVFREGPSVKDKKIKVLKYGTLVELIEIEKKKETIRLRLPTEGNWLKVRHDEIIGFIFSPLVEPTDLNSYQCAKPERDLADIVYMQHDMNTEFCRDGSYIINTSYNCSGPCWEHGCWRITKAQRLELKRKKVSELKGLGKPKACTHFCTYDSYVVTNTNLLDEPWRYEPDLDGFAEYYKTNRLPANSNLQLKSPKSKFSCRDSRQ